MNSIENQKQSATKIDVVEPINSYKRPPVFQVTDNEEEEADVVLEEKKLTVKESTGDKIKRSFFDRYVDKIKDFLDNAE
jgi:cell division protein FtsA